MFVFSTIVFAICIIYGANFKQSFIVYSDGYVDNGNVETMNITSFYGFTDEGRDDGSYKGSFEIPEDGKVELRVKAKTEGNSKMFMCFKDGEGIIIFEETSNSIFFSKVIDAKKGKWFFQINGQNAKTGDFKYMVLQK